MAGKRGSLWGLLIGAAALLLGALVGLPRDSLLGLVWTLAGALLLGYNAWALLRGSGKTPPRDFPLPDPEEEARQRAAQKTRMAELERPFRGGEFGYEDYVLERMEILNDPK